MSRSGERKGALRPPDDPPAAGGLREIIFSFFFLSSIAPLLPGCTGVDPDRGLTEPIRVTHGTFEAAEMPGQPPLPAEAPPGTPQIDPKITLIESVNNVFSPGQAGKSLSGRASESAVAIGLRFADLGAGYWVVPAGGLDPQAPGERTWSLGFEIGDDVPPGLHPLRIVAIDDAGAAGTQAELATCVTSPVPDNLNACDPTIEPPAAVLSLSWENEADLDLGLVTPSGKFVDAKHPSTVTGDPEGVDPAKDGAIDRDANAACASDSIHRENVVWPLIPAPGTYLVYVNLFDACGEAAAPFTATFYLREQRPDGTFALSEKIRAPGELFAAQANGGGAQGLYVTTFTFQ